MSRKRAKAPRVRPVTKSLQEYGRGVAGGILFSLPLLYTMEVWWAGFISHPLRLLAYVLATFVLLLGYNRYGGLRRDASMSEVAIDSVEELGIGLVLSALILWLLGRVTPEMPASEIVGIIVIEAMTVAIGVSVGTAQLGGEKEDEGLGSDEPEGSGGGGGARGANKGRGAAAGATADEIHFGGQLVIALCGAVLFAANVAPTEEIIMIAAEISSWKLLGLALLSLALGAFILYYSEFRGAQEFVRMDGAAAVIAGTGMTYAVALVASTLILWFFGRFDGQAFINCVAQTIVLAVAASLGASAGRLLLQ